MASPDIPRIDIPPIEIPPLDLGRFQPGSSPTDFARVGLGLSSGGSVAAPAAPALKPSDMRAAGVPVTSDANPSTAESLPSAGLPPQTNGKPPTWGQVMAHPGTKDLNAQDFEQLRKGYFAKVVAPQLDPEDLTAAWATFQQQTAPKQSAPAAPPSSGTSRLLTIGRNARPAVTPATVQAPTPEGDPIQDQVIGADAVPAAPSQDSAIVKAAPPDPTAISAPIDAQDHPLPSDKAIESGTASMFSPAEAQRNLDKDYSPQGFAELNAAIAKAPNAYERRDLQAEKQRRLQVLADSPASVTAPKAEPVPAPKPATTADVAPGDPIQDQAIGGDQTPATQPVAGAPDLAADQVEVVEKARRPIAGATAEEYAAANQQEQEMVAKQKGTVPPGQVTPAQTPPTAFDEFDMQRQAAGSATEPHLDAQALADMRGSVMKGEIPPGENSLPEWTDRIDKAFAKPATPAGPEITGASPMTPMKLGPQFAFGGHLGGEVASTISHLIAATGQGVANYIPDQTRTGAGWVRWFSDIGSDDAAREFGVGRMAAITSDILRDTAIKMKASTPVGDDRLGGLTTAATTFMLENAPSFSVASAAAAAGAGLAFTNIMAQAPFAIGTAGQSYNAFRDLNYTPLQAGSLALAQTAINVAPMAMTIGKFYDLADVHAGELLVTKLASFGVTVATQATAMTAGNFLLEKLAVDPDLPLSAFVDELKNNVAFMGVAGLALGAGHMLGNAGAKAAVGSDSATAGRGSPRLTDEGNASAKAPPGNANPIWEGESTRVADDPGRSLLVLKGGDAEPKLGAEPDVSAVDAAYQAAYDAAIAAGRSKASAASMAREASPEGRPEPKINSVPTTAGPAEPTLQTQPDIVEPAKEPTLAPAAEVQPKGPVATAANAETQSSEPPKTPEILKQEPVAPPPQVKAGEPLATPEYRSELEAMAKNAGWHEVGGKMIRDEEGNVTGRTSWIPKEDWWPGRPDKLNPAQVQEAVRKALAGEPLKVAEKRTIDYMLESAQSRLKTSGFLSQVDLPVNDQNIIDHGLSKQAADIDPDKFEKLSLQYIDDDAAFMAGVREIINGNESAKARAVGEASASTGTSSEAAANATEAAPAVPPAQTGQEVKVYDSRLPAMGQAGLATKKTGIKHEAVPHPTEPDKWVVRPIPQETTPQTRPVRTTDLATPPQTEQPGKETERFTGVYKRGVTEFNARRELKRLSAEKPNLDWRIEPALQFGPDRFAVVGHEKSAPIDLAAHEASTSPLNDLPEPTAEQKAAGNFKMGHVRLHGLDVTIENPQGSVRSGVDANGKPWATEMAHHYGYIRNTEDKTGEHIDTFIGPNPASENVFVVDQRKPGNGHFDEFKVMLGFDTLADAKKGYAESYTRGWDGLKDITAMTLPQLKDWLKTGDHTKPIAGQVPAMTAGESAKAEPLAFEPKIYSSRMPAIAEAGRLTKAGTRAEALPHQTESGKWIVRPATARDGDALPGELAAETTGFRRYTPAATAATPNPDLARPDAIRDAIRKLFDVPINERGIKNRRALGIYKVKPQTIRVRNQNDIDVIAHETGHHFSETNQDVRTLMAKHAGELLGITPDAYANETKKLRLEEGFAEFVRLYLTQRSEAQRVAPGFSKEFDQFIDDQPRYRAIFDQLHQMIEDWFALDPAGRILAKVGARPQSITERLGKVFSKDRLIFEALDNWRPLKLMVRDLAPDIAPSKDPFKAAHLLSGDAAVIEDWLVNGTIPNDYAKRADPKNFGKPLHDIIAPVAKNLREFSAYLIAKHAAELKQRGKEKLFTSDEIRAGLGLETPEFKRAAQEIYAYNDRLLDYAVEGGLLSAHVAEKFGQYTAYIPFFRERGDENVGPGSNPFKRLRGGTNNLRDPISNIIQNTANILYATNRNAVLAKAYELAKAVPGGGRWIEEIPMPEKALQVSTQKIIEELDRQGVKVDTSMAENLATMQTFWQRNPVADDRTRTIIVKVNGNSKALQINDTMLWKALQAFEPVDLGLLGKMLAIPSDLLRAGVTLSPEFMARNFMRDTLTGFIQSERGMLPVAGTIGGFKEVLTRSDTAKLYRAFGAAYGDLWKGETTQTRKILDRMAKRGKFDPRTILTPSGIISVLHSLGSISEAGTRVAEFKKSAGKGTVDELIGAAYNAREVSVDFGMHGHNQTIRFLTRITPFLNPAMQGWYKAARTGREQFFRTLLRGSALAAFSLALFSLNRGKDWYDEIEQWEKNVYWHIDVGLRDKESNVIPLRIPKPFEWGAVFGSVPEGLAQVAIDHNGAAFAKRLGSIWNDVFAIRAVPTAILVPAEIWANKNTFTDRTIVPESVKNLDPEKQHGPYTSLTARKVGELTGTSPGQIDHLIRGFLGTMGVYGTMLADQGVRAMGDYPPLPDSTWRQMPVVKAFVHDPDTPNSRYLNDFYNLLDKARRADATYKHQEGEPADAYFEKNKETIEITSDANRLARDLAKLRKETREIQESRDYTGSEKLRLISENNRLSKAMAKEFSQQHPH